jgi:uncharacterized membrane protein YqaE (UPF0057 family)
MSKALEKFLLTILALLLPPVAVFIKIGLHWQLYINLSLCLAFYVPAVLHAVWLVRHRREALMPEPEELDYTSPDDQGTRKPSRIEPRLDW